MIGKIKINLANIIALCAMSFIAYYILVCDNVFNISVSAIIAWSHQLSMNKHLVVLAIIPVYIAIIIFGVALLGIYLSSMLQGLIKAIKRQALQKG